MDFGCRVTVSVLVVLQLAFVLSPGVAFEPGNRPTTSTAEQLKREKEDKTGLSLLVNVNTDVDVEGEVGSGPKITSQHHTPPPGGYPPGSLRSCTALSSFLRNWKGGETDSPENQGKCTKCQAKCAELLENPPFNFRVDWAEYPHQIMDADTGLPLPSVEIVNATTLHEVVLRTDPSVKNNSYVGNCTVVIFFTRWCPWCAKAAPYLNALPRAFQNIRFTAIDAYNNMSTASMFGIYGTPSVLLFHNGRLHARYSNGSIGLGSVSAFLETFTDQRSGKLEILTVDYRGPLSSKPQKNGFHKLLLKWSWWLILGSLVYGFFKFYLKSELFFQLFLQLWNAAQGVIEDVEFKYA